MTYEFVGYMKQEHAKCKKCGMVAAFMVTKKGALEDMIKNNPFECICGSKEWEYLGTDYDGELYTPKDEAHTCCQMTGACGSFREGKDTCGKEGEE